MVNQGSLKIYMNEIELDKDNQALKELEIGDNVLEVEVIFNVHIEVAGKGRDYSVRVEVQSTDLIEVLRYKVPFFKIFLQRRH